MKLSDILIQDRTDEAYLACQRERHRARITKDTDFLAEKRTDEEYVARLRTAASYAMQDMFVLPGSGGERMHVGTPPAWHERRTDDEEYVWHLNRMDYFHTLSELYVLTGERAYGEKALGDLINWIDTCPMYPLPDEGATEEDFWALAKPFRGEVDPWRSLEVGIRVNGSWAVLYDRLLLTDLMTPEVHTKIAVSFYEHMLALYRLTPRFWPAANHNHYLTEMLGLLRAACLFPDVRQAQDWQAFALRELGRCAKNQFTPEGAQVEGCPGYHSGSLNEYLTVARMARDFGFTFPDEMRTLCTRAARHAVYTTLPDGRWASIGDTPMLTGVVHTTRCYYQSFGELGPMANILAIHPNHDERIIPASVQETARAQAAAAPGGDNDQRTLGQYMARTGWTREDSYFLFSCATPINNGHTHQDPMSFILYLQGDPVVIDPSYFAYRSCPERKLFKSPEYHSTLTFDDKPPFEYLSMWGYSAQKEGHIRNSYRMDGVYAADASHHNYDPDFHKRLCALVGDDVFIVADDVVNMTKTDVRLYFHMDDPTVRIEGGEAVSSRIRVLLPEGVEAEMLPGEKSPFTDLREPTSRIRLTDTSHDSRLYLTIFTKRDDVTKAYIQRREDGVYISYTDADGEHIYRWVFSCSFGKVQ